VYSLPVLNYTSLIRRITIQESDIFAAKLLMKTNSLDQFKLRKSVKDPPSLMKYTRPRIRLSHQLVQEQTRAGRSHSYNYVLHFIIKTVFIV
jgi:hypothetical protein